MGVKAGTLVQVSDRVRVERGPAKKKAKASDKLLSDEVTAKHYKPGKPDAEGKPIEPGKEMAYLDWKGEHVWKVYKLIVRPSLGNKYVIESEHATRDAAMEAAQQLAKELHDKYGAVH